MKLSETVTSTVVKGRVYGNAGDEVEVISDDGQVAIVKDLKGNRFPVESALLTECFQPEGQSDIASKPVETKPIIKPAPQRFKKIKPAPPKQNTLFI